MERHHRPLCANGTLERTSAPNVPLGQSVGACDGSDRRTAPFPSWIATPPRLVRCRRVRGVGRRSLRGSRSVSRRWCGFPARAVPHSSGSRPTTSSPIVPRASAHSGRSFSHLIPNALPAGSPSSSWSGQNRALRPRPPVVPRPAVAYSTPWLATRGQRLPGLRGWSVLSCRSASLDGAVVFPRSVSGRSADASNAAHDQEAQ